MFQGYQIIPYHTIPEFLKASVTDFVRYFEFTTVWLSFYSTFFLNFSSNLAVIHMAVQDMLILEGVTIAQQPHWQRQDPGPHNMVTGPLWPGVVLYILYNTLTGLCWRSFNLNCLTVPHKYVSCEICHCHSHLPLATFSYLSAVLITSWPVDSRLLQETVMMKGTFVFLVIYKYCNQVMQICFINYECLKSFRLQ